MTRSDESTENKKVLHGPPSSQLGLKDLIDTKQVDLNTAIVKRILRTDEVGEKACLVVLQGAEAGEIIPLDNKGIVIGRNRECDVILKGEGISRTHAKVELTDSDQAVIRDLGSTNGTFVNGHRVMEAVLAAGETVLLGQDTVLKFMLHDQIDQLYASYARERLSEAKEAESARIARELHDELGQILTRMKTDLSLLNKNLQKEDWPRSSHYLNRVTGILELVNVAIKSVQSITRGLRPVMLDNLGLMATLEWMARDFQTRTGIRCVFDNNANDKDYEPSFCTAVYRIVQESLTNVERHAKASSVSMKISEDGGILKVSIKDDGIGISKETANKHHWAGILGMNERAHIFGGQIRVTGEPGQGTKVQLVAPIRKTSNSSHPKALIR